MKAMLSLSGKRWMKLWRNQMAQKMYKITEVWKSIQTFYIKADSEQEALDQRNFCNANEEDYRHDSTTIEEVENSNEICY